MSDERARERLAQLITERREDYASLSRLLGRNAAYIQQYLKRGSPRRLSEDDRAILARYFRIDESELGRSAPAESVAPHRGNQLVEVASYDITVAAGAGTYVDGEAAAVSFGFDPRWLQRIAHGRPDQLSIVTVTGDSMAPTLMDSEDILVDASENTARVRDGIYVLRRDDLLVVKRLALSPASKRITVSSDNPAYPSWPDCKPETLSIIGRVIWAARRVA